MIAHDCGLTSLALLLMGLDETRAAHAEAHNHQQGLLMLAYKALICHIARRCEIRHSLFQLSPPLAPFWLVIVTRTFLATLSRCCDRSNFHSNRLHAGLFIFFSLALNTNYNAIAHLLDVILMCL
jgi:hypothetical protein